MTCGKARKLPLNMLPEIFGEAMEDIVNPTDGTVITLHHRGEGDVLLLVHGWTLDHRAFAPQMALSDRLHLVCFDRRGFGQSQAAPDLSKEVSDLAAIVDSLQTSRVHLLGVSQGARLALRYACTQSEKLSSLILQGVVVDDFHPETEDPDPIPFDHFRALVENGDLETLHREWLDHPMMASDELSSEHEQLLQEIVGNYSGNDLLGQGETAKEVSVTDMLPEMRVPTLIITGDRETPTRKAHSAHLRELLPMAREVILSGCGHLSNLGKPHGYNELVMRFIDEARA